MNVAVLWLIRLNALSVLVTIHTVKSGAHPVITVVDVRRLS